MVTINRLGQLNRRLGKCLTLSGAGMLSLLALSWITYIIWHIISVGDLDVEWGEKLFVHLGPLDAWLLEKLLEVTLIPVGCLSTIFFLKMQWKKAAIVGAIAGGIWGLYLGC
ncbi:MAG: hypothetical protein V3U29_03295, partial [Phycisphaeraceae bacterium]